ncbi:MAG: ABC transporter substrate-binding protein [Pseudomonadota bacterium]
MMQTNIPAHSTGWLAALWCLGALTGLSLAAVAGPADDTVREATDLVVSALDEQRATYAEDPAPLHDRMTEILEQYVAFDRIVSGVVGKHKAALNDDQRARFRSVFVASLVDLYADSLISLQAKTIEVREAKIRKKGRAQVSMDVTTTNGSDFTLEYSMGQEDDGRWLIRNMIVGGINLGLTFRNQFDAMIGEQAGDVEAVLVRWRETTTEDNANASTR